jgi:hypothetical protein
MIKCLNDKAPVIGEDKIQSYFETLHALTGILKGNNIALITDAWTVIAKEGYVTYTMYFIHDFSLSIFKKMELQQQLM